MRRNKRAGQGSTSNMYAQTHLGNRDKNIMMLEPLEIAKLPSMPYPWLSVDPGETWLWGDFFLTFQKRPPI
jgi:hypothetical protein